MTSPELDDARRLFEQAERESDPERKFAALEEALDITDDYGDAHAEASSEREYTTNLRHAYLRRLLIQLVDMRHIQFEPWIAYIKLLLLRVNPEVQTILASETPLHDRYREFIALWKDEFLDVLQRLK